jgi:hypothetical protein
VARMNSKEVARHVVICTIRPMFCCLRNLGLGPGMEVVMVWNAPVVLLLFDFLSYLWA